MFCYKCGTQLQSGYAFCPSCGTARRTPEQQTYPQPYQQPPEGAYTQPQPYGAYPQYGAPIPAPAPKKGLRWYVIAPIAAVLAIAIGIGIFFIVRSSVMPVERAIMGAGRETMQRLENSPLGAFPMLYDIARNGTVTVSFDYEGRWTDRVRGDVAIATDIRGAGDFEQALTGEVSVYGQNIDFEMFINDERLALRSQYIDSNYYGITYSTFRDDIQIFGSLIGLDRATMNEIADMVESMESAMNMEAAGYEAYEVYADILKSVIENAERVTENDEITSSGEVYNVKRTDFIITKDVILTAINDLYYALADDENLRDAFALYSSYDYYGTDYNEFLREFRNAIREFEDDYSETSVITVSFYLSSRNRLMRAALDADVTYDGYRELFDASIDFGTSATDKWTLKVDGAEVLSWEYRERASTVDNIIYINTGYDNVELSSVWNPTSGAFTLAYREGRHGDEISGVYNPTSNGFNMRFDNLSGAMYGAERFELSIGAFEGAIIPDIEYINLDEWGNALIEKIEEAFGGMFGFPYGGGYGSGGGFVEPVPPIYEFPPETPSPVPPAVAPEITGAWEFYDGVGTYFFWSSSYVEFYSDGTVYNFDYDDYGTWLLSGNTLNVTDSIGDIYVFQVSISGDTLSITDHDGDTGYFTRSW